MSINGKFKTQVENSERPADRKFLIAGNEQNGIRVTTTTPIMEKMGVDSKGMLGVAKQTHGWHVPASQVPKADNSNKVSVVNRRAPTTGQTL